MAAAVIRKVMRITADLSCACNNEKARFAAGLFYGVFFTQPFLAFARWHRFRSMLDLTTYQQSADHAQLRLELRLVG
jgi:hypothetical protein